MTPERWREVRRVFDEALERPEAERGGWVARACDGDESLRAEVESLLRSADEAEGFLEGAALGPAVAPPARIGPYRVLGTLGRGGMGEVYLGVRADEEFRKKVAIKVVRHGMDAEAVRRFRQERQILAGLEHPSIARLLDGGSTDDGRPWVALEYVEGKSLLEWADARGLGVAGRVELFRTVCGAVQFAHQNLVVHRDLKPANILVTADGTPKLLDFGIAKLLNAEVAAPAANVTHAEARLLTPDYASPEQVRGERITTASDVYSLGVVLFELLAGRRPYEVPAAPPAEVARVVCEAEAPRASSVCPAERRREIAGDLDTIVLKALRKEPDRRYASAEQLAEDLRRHAEGLPVAARRDTLAYRAGKFVRRHRLGVAAAAAVLVTLVGGIFATARQARIAHAEKERADRRFQDVRRLSNAFLFELHDAIAPLPGSTAARELIVRRALEYLGTLAREAGDDTELQRELAAAYERLADVQGVSGGAGLGDAAGALASLSAAVHIREALVEADPRSVGDRSALARALGPAGSALAATGDAAGALRASRRAVALLSDLVAEVPGDAAVKRSLADARFFLSNRLQSAGDHAETVAEMRRSLALFEELSAASPEDLRLRRSVALGHKYVASALAEPTNPARDPAAALEEYGRARAMEEELVARDPANALYRRDLSHSWGGTGEALFLLGRSAEGTSAYRRAIALRKELAEADPRNSGIRHALARAYLNLGAYLTKAGEPAAGLDSLRQARGLLDGLGARDPANAFVAVDAAVARLRIGDAHAARGDRHEARRSWEEARRALAALDAAGKLAPAQKAPLREAEDALGRREGPPPLAREAPREGR